MPTIIPTNPFESEVVLFILKAATLLILIFYAIFALIIIRQVDLMGKTLITGIAPSIKIIAVVHAVFAVGLIFLALLIL